VTYAFLALKNQTNAIMKIPHLTQTDRSEFYPLIREALRGAENQFPVTVPLGKPGGYNGEVTLTTRAANEAEFEANLELTDWTRFPARIRAAATALRDSGRFGTFNVTHAEGQVTIDRTAD
jgi:hypothetical protein